jgi:membrane fusion protein (multidrug efflux system)
LPSQFSRTTRSLSNDTAKYAVVAWLMAATVLAAWMGWFLFGSVNVYEISKKARLEVQQAAHSVEASLQGRIIATKLAIGLEVNAGDVLVELDAGSEKLRLQEEQARLQAIPPRIDSLRREIAFREQSGVEDRKAAAAGIEAARFRGKEAQAGVEFARDNARRLKDESTFGSVAQIEALRALSESQKLTASSEALASEVRRVESDAQNRAHQSQAQIQGLKSTLATLEGDMGTIQATIARLKLDIEKHLVRAPVSGRIGDAAPLRVGANVTQAQKLAIVVPRGALMIVADFPPAAVVGRIKPGQAARMRLDGFPWAQYGSIDARVSRVGSEIRDGQVRVEFAVASTSSSGMAMQHGLPGSIEVQVDRASPAVMILRAAGQMLSTAPQPQLAAPPLERLQ